MAGDRPACCSFAASARSTRSACRQRDSSSMTSSTWCEPQSRTPHADTMSTSSPALCGPISREANAAPSRKPSGCLGWSPTVTPTRTRAATSPSGRASQSRHHREIFISGTCSPGLFRLRRPSSSAMPSVRARAPTRTPASSPSAIAYRVRQTSPQPLNKRVAAPR
jgi:hypothetical protein